MKKIPILFLSILSISCRESAKDPGNQQGPVDKNTITKQQPARQNDSLNWVNNFRAFRNAVYTHNKSDARLFVDFPVMNDNNEIWYLVNDGNDKSVHLDPDSIKPFTEQDFDKYFDKVFSKRFINTILKIKSEDLYKSGKVETIEFREGSNTTYKMYGTFDREERTLTLNLASNTVVKDDKGEVQDGGESNVIYQFSVIKNGEIRFKQVRLAG